MSENVNSVQPIVMRPGMKVIVHDPGFRDAADHVYDPGPRHRKVGIIREVDTQKVGADYLCYVEFNDRSYWHWRQDLRLS